MTYRPPPSGSPAVTPAALACPSCRSLAVVSTARKPSASGYWRCEQCGEIWNPGRRQEHPLSRGWRA